jgi:hypothetical protein
MFSVCAAGLSSRFQWFFRVVLWDMDLSEDRCFFRRADHVILFENFLELPVGIEKVI